MLASFFRDACAPKHALLPEHDNNKHLPQRTIVRHSYQSRVVSSLPLIFSLSPPPLSRARSLALSVSPPSPSLHTLASPPPPPPPKTPIIYLSGDKLDHLSYRHPRRKPVGVHDEVGADTGVGEGHVFLGHDDAAHPLLPVPRGKLVPHLIVRT